MNIDRFIGIKHKFNGRDFDGADCIGLCQLFYRAFGYRQNWDDGKTIGADWRKQYDRLFRYLEKNFRSTKNPRELRFGDAVLFDVDGDYHLGLYLEYGKVLAMQVPCHEGVSQSTIYHKDDWEPAFVRGFHHDNV